MATRDRLGCTRQSKTQWTVCAALLIANVARAQNIDVKGTTTAEGGVFVGTGAGSPALFSGATAVGGGTYAGGISIWGRPRIGDWGQSLTLGEPNGYAGGPGMVLQIQGLKMFTGTSVSISTAPTLRNTLDDGSGNVGIKTTTPGGALDVNADYSHVALSSSHTPSGGLMSGDNSVLAVGTGAVSASYNLLSLSSGSAYGTSRMVVRSDGNVGIGTTTPQGALDVNGDIYRGGLLAVSGEAGGWLRINQAGAFPNGTHFSHRANFYGGITTGSWWSVDPGAGNLLVQGNLGVGTTTPGQKLDVNGYIRVGSTNGEGGTIQLAGNNGTTVWMENINGTFRLVNSPWTADIFHVDQGGNTNVVGSLTVAGTIQSNSNPVLYEVSSNCGPSQLTLNATCDAYDVNGYYTGTYSNTPVARLLPY